MTTPLTEWRIERQRPNGQWVHAGTILVPLEFTEAQAMAHYESTAILGPFLTAPRRALKQGVRRV